MKRKRRRVREEWIDYLIEISTWDWDYGFGLGDQKYDIIPYFEHRHLEVTGTLRFPSSLKVETASITVMPDPRLELATWKDGVPLGTGSLSIQDRHMSALLSVPNRSFDSIIQMLIAGKWKYVLLHGHKPRFRKALIRSFTMTSKFNEDDLMVISEGPS